MESEINQLYANLGKVIKRFRQKAQMSKKELAEGICDNSYITLIEKGDRCPNAIIMCKICEKLGISPNLLYQCLFLNDIEHYLENEINTFACLRRLDYFQANYYAHLNRNCLPSFLSKREIPEIGDIFVDSLKKRNFAEQLEKLKHNYPQIEFLFMNDKKAEKDVYMPILRLYDIYTISDYVLLHIFAGKSELVYSKLKKELEVFGNIVIIDVSVHQMLLNLKFEMALICNDLKRYKEAIHNVEEGLSMAKEYTLGASIPYLLYAKGETFWLRGEEELGTEFIKKAVELHKLLTPKSDGFIIAKIRMEQLGITISGD